MNDSFHPVENPREPLPLIDALRAEYVQALTQSGKPDFEAMPLHVLLMEQARAIVRKHKRGSIGLVQRYLRIGYNSAARMIEQMGILSPMMANGGRTYIEGSMIGVPVVETRSQMLKSAGFTPRDRRLTCDECGAKFTQQFAPLHKCESAASGSGSNNAVTE